MTTEAHRSRRPRFGMTTALPRQGAAWRAFAQSVEAAGVDVLTFADHLAPALAPFTGAAAAALTTERLRVGTLVLNNDFHHPVLIAREAATLSEVSGGRFELGLGAGHMKSEYDAAGLRFDSGAGRVDRLIESVAVVRALLAGAEVHVDGEHYRVHAEAATLTPAPGAPVPLLIGGNGTRVLQLAGRVADIVGLAGISHNRDATEVRFSHFSSAGLADRIAVVRAAAGDRFEQIELNALIQVVVCTKDRAATADALAAQLGVPAELLLDSPFVLLGTHEQMAETLSERQRRLGISYWTVFDEWAGRPSALPDLAEVIALLR
ncbi:TIGR03621 family F420-dependent LLM class oxidoreductase [Mycobacterium sp. SMC-4]|uniref:TIGR03621 family F420-dependent LLM class oxidoreductase n=1 Tax=Mycobacterium sp. SMC-4 TaxID=2857059 RepID=UPI003CFCDE2D